MVDITPAPVTTEELALWFQTTKELAALKNKEMLMRQRIFKHFFPEPKEGTNTHVLPDTYQLKATYGFNRKIVDEAMQAMFERPTIGFDGHGAPLYGHSRLEQAGISHDAIVRWKPELALTAYRELTAEQQHLVDQMLLVSPSTPALEIVPPSKRSSGKKVAP